MIRRFWPLLAIAFVVGSLFRLYTDTGIGFYRMFGTLGIVFLGAVASRIVVTAQLEEGEREVARAMAGLPDDFDVWRLSRRGADRLVIGPRAAVVVLASSIAHYARGRGLMRGLEQLSARAEKAAEVARRHLEETAGDGGEKPVYRLAVLLRRQARQEERRWLEARGIQLVELDRLTDQVAMLGREAPLLTGAGPMPAEGAEGHGDEGDREGGAEEEERRGAEAQVEPGEPVCYTQREPLRTSD